MIKQQLQVRLFHKQTGLEVFESPQTEIDAEDYALRMSLAVSKQHEYFDAFRPATDGTIRVDQAKALKGLCDRLYVLFGDAHTLGLSYLLPVAFRMVHQANMAKLWTGEEVANLPPGFTCERVSSGLRRYLVKNSLGNKIKSPSFQPVNLSDLLDEMSGQELLNYEQASGLVFGDNAEAQELQDLRDQLGEDALANFTIPRFDLDHEDSD